MPVRCQWRLNVRQAFTPHLRVHVVPKSRSSFRELGGSTMGQDPSGPLSPEHWTKILPLLTISPGLPRPVAQFTQNCRPKLL